MPFRLARRTRPWCWWCRRGLSAVSGTCRTAAAPRAPSPAPGDSPDPAPRRTLSRHPPDASPRAIAGAGWMACG